MTSARNQPQYQVRFDWGLDGAAAIAPGADVVVWVDALAEAPTPVLDFDGAVVTGSVGSRLALADWVIERQAQKGDRVTVAVIAAGSDGRFSVEDLLGAGAVIDALADVGIDYISPEAAAAVGAFAGLRNATGHVLSACVTGQELMAASGREVIAAAREAADSAEFGILQEFSLRA